MSHEVYPSQDNISTYLGSNADWAEEKQIASWLSIRGSSCAEQFVYSGLDLSIGTGLSVDVAAGVAVVDGRILKTTGTESIGSLTDSTTNYIFLQATITSDLIASFALVSNTTGTRPSNGVLLGTAVAAGGVITSVVNVIKKPRGFSAGADTTAGTYTGDGTSNREFSMGGQPRLVMILSNDHDKIAISGNQLGNSATGYQIAPGTLSTIATATRRPEITADGFLVSDDADNLSLNKSGSSYTYWAWL